jgi:hypothetical protein
LGAAKGGASDILCLGRGGQVTLTFPVGIRDGKGADFAIFENGFDDAFLELAWVEVSSDGIHFVRFPNYSYTLQPVGGFGTVETRLLYGLASKYRQNYGTPFDLNELRLAFSAAQEGNTDFSPDFTQQLTNNFPTLNFEKITHIRLIDIVGDGSAHDARGTIIYDPYPTVGSAGLDLDAIGILNASAVVPLPYPDWAQQHAVSLDGKGDADGDGIIDAQEYMLGGDPHLASSAPKPTLKIQLGSIIFEYAQSRHAEGTCLVEQSNDLNAWSNAIPTQTTQQLDADFIHHKLQFPTTAPQIFFRLIFHP